MPDTLPHPPDLIGGDRVVVDDTVADPCRRSRHRPASPSPSARAGTRGTHPPPIARRLAILVIVAILPVLAFSAFMIVYYAQAQRIRLHAATTGDFARHVARDRCRDRAAGSAILATAPRSPELRNGTGARSMISPRRRSPNEPGERVSLMIHRRMFVMSTFVPFGTDLGRAGRARRRTRAVVDTRQPLVSDLFIGTVRRNPIPSRSMSP